MLLRRPLMPRARSSSASPMILCAVLVLQGCSAAPDDTRAPQGGSPGVNPLGRPRCQAPAGVSGSPATIEEAVNLLNALPKPTSVACFVESLDRPLTAFATSSSLSAQPALSHRSPRVFLRLDKLWLSVVVDGESSYLVEFSQALDTEPLRTIKAELLLPLTEAVPQSLPYERVRFGTGTACGLCHTGETRADGVSFTDAFASAALRPRPETRVSIDEKLRLESASCDWQVEPHRCELLSSIFDGGTVVEEAFPHAMPTLF